MNRDRDCENACFTCMWWSEYAAPTGEDPEEGLCHRHAPKPILIPESELNDKNPLWSNWPRTSSHEYCGEWKSDVG